MNKNISIEEMKVNILLQESSDKIIEINKKLSTSHSKPELVPPGIPKSGILKNAHDRIQLLNQKAEIEENTQARIQELGSTSSFEKQQEYQQKIEDWKKNPDKYATPTKDEEEKNRKAKDELTKSDPHFDKKYDFAKNEKALEKGGGSSLKFEPTPNYTVYQQGKDQGIEPSSRNRDKDVDKE